MNMVEEDFGALQMLKTVRVCKLLDISDRTVTRMLADGRLTGIKVGSEWRIHRSSVERLLEVDRAVGD